MAVWGQGDAVLPATVEAIVGRLFHAVRDAVLRRGLLGAQNTETVRDVIRAMKVEEEQRLVTVDGCSALIPLEQSIGQRRWLELTAGLIAWARVTATTSTVSLRYESTARPDDVTEPGDTISFGPERQWISTVLRLRGRPDESAVAADGAVEVTDYKTGNVTDDEGSLRPSVETQVQLYLLMAEVLTGRPARGRIIGDRVTPVRWGDREREAIRVRLFTMNEAFPPGAHSRPSEVAKAGPHCIGCRLRPRCPTYFESVPPWWTEGHAQPRPLPFDTWGTVTSYEEHEDITLRIRDAGRRSVIVRGLSPRPGLDSGCVDSELYLFNLQSSEDLNHHGRRLHPQAFHERSPGPRWPSARQVVVYGAPCDRPSSEDRDEDDTSP